MRNKTTIFKDGEGKKGDNARYAQINNDLLNDKRLSFQAIGIICHLLSKPDYWKPDVKLMSKQFPGTEGKTRKGIDELIVTGYMEMINEYDKENGRFTGKYYKVYEKPLFEVGFRKLENKHKKFNANEEILNENPIHKS